MFSSNPKEEMYPITSPISGARIVPQRMSEQEEQLRDILTIRTMELLVKAIGPEKATEVRSQMVEKIRSNEPAAAQKILNEALASTAEKTILPGLQDM